LWPCFNLDGCEIEPLHDQLREIYGRTVYSHKTHIIQAGMDLRKHNKIKVAQIVLGALTTAGVVTAFLGKEYWGLGISALTSAALTALIAYTKDLDLGIVAAEHKTTSNQLWNIREKYLDLITDLQAGAVSADEIRQRRDALREDLNKVYAAARITSPEAYGEAQKALKMKEDMTFSPDEIDMFLPIGLRKNKALRARPSADLAEMRPPPQLPCQHAGRDGHDGDVDRRHAPLVKWRRLRIQVRIRGQCRHRRTRSPEAEFEFPDVRSLCNADSGPARSRFFSWPATAMAAERDRRRNLWVNP
jgi:RimJ/RimL family protein N-acetyltransferase